MFLVTLDFLVLKLWQTYYFIFDIQQLKRKSLYISPAASYFHEIWANFGLAGQFEVYESGDIISDYFFKIGDKVMGFLQRLDKSSADFCLD